MRLKNYYIPVHWKKKNVENTTLLFIMSFISKDTLGWLISKSQHYTTRQVIFRYFYDGLISF